MTIDPCNLFAVPDTARLPDAPEYLETLAQSDDVRIERIISFGHVTPQGTWYDQEEDEWVSVMAGSARLVWEDDRETLLEAGDHIFIPKHTLHRVVYTSQPCIWLAVFGKAEETSRGNAPRQNTDAGSP